MIQSVFSIGIVLTAITIILGFILAKSSKKSGYGIYYPFLALFGIGLFLLLFATILDKIVMLGAGLGGWGIACLFSAAVGLIVTSIVDASVQEA